MTMPLRQSLRIGTYLMRQKLARGGDQCRPRIGGVLGPAGLRFRCHTDIM